jgi:hypothetical protein
VKGGARGGSDKQCFWLPETMDCGTALMAAETQKKKLFETKKR